MLQRLWQWLKGRNPRPSKIRKLQLLYRILWMWKLVMVLVATWSGVAYQVQLKFVAVNVAMEVFPFARLLAVGVASPDVLVLVVPVENHPKEKGLPFSCQIWCTRCLPPTMDSRHLVTMEAKFRNRPRWHEKLLLAWFERWQPYQFVPGRAMSSFPLYKNHSLLAWADSGG